jgi:N-acetylglucosaminyldiphosphoundecaprenol N-acetyl-beta-D-mannosaminyltransferase
MGDMEQVFAWRAGMRDNWLMKNTVTIGGVKFDCLTQAGAAGMVAERIAQRQYSHPFSVFTPNTEQLMQVAELPGFLEVLNGADVRVPDSMGLVGADWWRAFTTGRQWRVRERVAGVDLAESLLSEASIKGWKVALIGGIGNASQIAIDTLKKRFEGLSIWCVPVGRVMVSGQRTVVSGVNKMDVTMENEDETLRLINEIRPDLLLVGFGAPKQEVWVMKHGGKLQAQAVMVVGGAIDMWSGVQIRAPQWMRQWSLEWLWRLVQQPGRIGRQMRLARFAGLVVRGKV